ncbi:YfiR family protein [Mangrovibacterium sp.]|uniref:YfiR family protein n=1 Tax=Mangrovibacterium sp. TaxID=1961364 RepID=UPI0035649AC1
MPVPENIQAALLPKVLKFSTTLPQNSKLRMLIVYNNNSATSKDDLIRGLGSAMEVKAVQSGELAANITKYDLVYFMPGVDDMASLCKIHKILSVSGISQYVEDGQISIAFGLQNNKPKIFINLTSLAKEGQSLSSEILRIAKVYN